MSFAAYKTYLSDQEIYEYITPKARARISAQKSLQPQQYGYMFDPTLVLLQPGMVERPGGAHELDGERF